MVYPVSPYDSRWYTFGYSVPCLRLPHFFSRWETSVQQTKRRSPARPKFVTILSVEKIPPFASTALLHSILSLFISLIAQASEWKPNRGSSYHWKFRHWHWSTRVLLAKVNSIPLPFLTIYFRFLGNRCWFRVYGVPVRTKRQSQSFQNAIHRVFVRRGVQSKVSNRNHVSSSRGIKRETISG